MSGHRRLWLGTTALGLVLASAAVPRGASAQTASDTAPPVQLPTMSVEGSGGVQGGTDYKVDQPSMNKYTSPLVDTPQTITTIPRQVLQDQNVTTLRDALRNVSGISLNAGEASRQGDSIAIRGFTASNDIYMDGMNDFGSYYRDPFNYDQIEVLTGPSSVIFGRGSTGGVVNQVSKAPFMDPYNAGSVTLGTNLTKRVTADVNTPVSDLGQNTAFRINFMAQDNYFTDRDIAENSRFGIAPSIAFGIGTNSRTTFSFFHQTEYDIPDYGVPWVDYKGSNIANPAGVTRQNFYGFKDSDYLRTNADVATGKYEYDFDKSNTFRDQIRYAHYLRDFRITEPQVTTTVTPGTALGTVAVTRNEISGQSVETFLENQADVTSRFSTGFIDHTAVTGFALGKQTSDPSRFTYTGTTATNLANPNPYDAVNGAPALTSQIGVTAYTQGVYAIDTLALDKHWDLLAAVRYDRFVADVHQNVANGATQPVSAFHTVNEMPSYRGAIVYKPTDHGSIYVQYGTSFDPSAEGLSLTVGSAPLPPVKNETYEAGSKWELFHERLTLSGALFQIEQYNAKETDPTNSLNQVLAGDILVQGFSLGAVGRATDKWQIFAGYTYLDAVVVTSPFSDKGNRPANTPRNTFNFWNTYDITQRVQLGGGVNFVGDRYASSFNDTLGERREAPGYWTGQAMVKYRLTDAVNVQLNVYNIANKYYYDQIHPMHIVPGEGRTALLSTNFQF